MDYTCEVCSKPFSRDRRGAKFCSRSCYGLAKRGQPRLDLQRRVALTCAACGKTFEAGGRTGHSKKAQFCSNRCSGDARLRGGSQVDKLMHTHAAYIGGLLDGEGSVILYRRGRAYALRVGIANSYRPVLEWLADVTGCGCIVTKQVADPKRHKLGYMWNLSSQAGASLLGQIQPYLIIKREQADLAIDFQRRRMRSPALRADKTWQEDYRARMAALNKRGP